MTFDIACVLYTLNLGVRMRLTNISQLTFYKIHNVIACFSNGESSITSCDLFYCHDLFIPSKQFDVHHIKYIYSFTRGISQIYNVFRSNLYRLTKQDSNFSLSKICFSKAHFLLEVDRELI